MDVNTIRLILIVVGALLVLLLYLWERHREKAAEDWNVNDRDDDIEEDDDAPEDPRAGQREPTIGTLDENDEERPSAWSRLLSRPRKKQRANGSSRAAAQHPDPKPAPAVVAPKLEPLLIQVSVISARGQPFQGPALMDVAESCGLHPGEMDIFHCLDEFDDETRVYFSMANMVKPGTFPFDAMENFSTPGLMLFAQLEGDPEDMTILDEMVATARKLAISFHGDVLDDTRCSLTVKRQDEMRKAVLANQLRWARAVPQ
jgi:cell division protein ZipA